MKRLLPYIKPYWPLILLALGLLYVMASTDLALPDYLSQIINIGIQQNGVDTPVPEVIRASSLENMALFQSEQDKAVIADAYHPVEPGSAEYASLSERFPALGQEPVYALKPLDASAAAALEQAMTKPLVILYGFQMMEQNPQQAAALLSPELAERLKSLPQGANLLTLLTQLPEAQAAEMKNAITRHLSTLEGTILRQMAVRAVGNEYSALGFNLQKNQTSYILRIGARMVLMALLAVATSIMVSYLASRTSAGVARDIRAAVFEKVAGFSSAEFNNFSTNTLITRTTNDVGQVQQVIFMVIRMAFTAPMIGIGGVIRAIDKSPNMWWLIALAVAILVMFIMLAFALALPKFKIMQNLVDRMNLVIRENLSGLMVVRAFNKQDFEEQRFDKANREVTGTLRFIGRVMTTMFPIINLIMTGLSVAIIWVGAREVAQSTLQVGNLIAFMQYSAQIMFSFMNLSMLFIFIPRAAISGDRIADVLETPILIRDPQEPQQLPKPVQGKVEFIDVDFRYPDAEVDVLHDISFTALPGQVTALIGSTGSGKSTVVNLIPRFFEVSKGSIRIDGVDIRSLKQRDLRAQIGFVPQKGLLFSGTIDSNMRLGDPNADEAVIREAIEIAQAADFVYGKPEQLNAEVSQGGTNFSGGQKQRLSIARALVKKPPIYIFDDSFSALDFKTDAALRKELKKKVGASTVLIVTQRVATAKNSDQILVLENGRLVGQGTHQELMKTCQTYQEIASSQLSQEELA
ncbi:MAG: ABC transporter ATP-binding protein [Chloroflexi bacterium]|jgi:ATP-binding cassette subfamily B protein|nr:ABC transporter ATP-binding protein [Anaerolineaceae bacterium]NLI44350.1 ABC transporter ATP-binding protein [Chloroflexota bacterium]